MKYFKYILKLIIVTVSLLAIVVITSNSWVEKAAKQNLYNSAKEIPHNKVGLLLGTGKYLVNGRINLYYKYRLNAAVKLYKEGKIDYILVSGDNSSRYYDEPTTIKRDLMDNGIPEDRIYLDYAGFRTLDSVIRSREIFGQKSITIISQQFHNERALFIAKRKGIVAIGFNAQDVNVHYGLKTRVRERFARVIMMLDLVFHKKPKFLGEKIIIE